MCATALGQHGTQSAAHGSHKIPNSMMITPTELRVRQIKGWIRVCIRMAKDDAVPRRMNSTALRTTFEILPEGKCLLSMPNGNFRQRCARITPDYLLDLLRVGHVTQSYEEREVWNLLNRSRRRKN